MLTAPSMLGSQPLPNRDLVGTPPAGPTATSVTHTRTLAIATSTSYCLLKRQFGHVLRATGLDSIRWERC